MAPTNNDNDQDWISSLARKAASSEMHTHDSASKKKHDKGKIDVSSVKSSSIGLSTKAERIQHRVEKRKKREERKQQLQQERLDRLAEKKSAQQLRLAGPSNANPSDARRGKIVKVQSNVPRRGMTSATKRALENLSTTLASTVSLVHSEPDKSRNRRDLINGLPPPPKGKATTRSTIHPHSSELQPRKRDYNGQGLARPSMYLPFNDAAFVPKLEEEFAEHIPGFFGKAKKGAGKKQREDEYLMLWKKCLKEKRGGDGGGGGKKRKIKDSDVARL